LEGTGGGEEEDAVVCLESVVDICSVELFERSIDEDNESVVGCDCVVVGCDCVVVGCGCVVVGCGCVVVGCDCVVVGCGCVVVGCDCVVVGCGCVVVGCGCVVVGCVVEFEVSSKFVEFVTDLFDKRLGLVSFEGIGGGTSVNRGRYWGVNEEIPSEEDFK
jgi:hypothetical protein